MIALFADGHVLLEDFPGSGKTTLARALGEAIDAATAATSDIAAVPPHPVHARPACRATSRAPTCSSRSTGGFVFRRGPMFAHVVLADEINRTSPKVQAAMLEAMAEKQVTVDDTHATRSTSCSS